jgi:nitrate/TMAO reductase-like tetraheme cytochrome c subunit
MKSVARYVCLPITPLFRRIRLPFTKRSLPLWVLLAAGLVVILPGTGAAIVYTNQPIFCTSCHEMSLHYATWRQSAHRDVGCEDCHVVPGMLNMFKSKINALRLVKEHAAGDVRATAIQGHVRDANCKRCHPQTHDLITYHDLKITHKAHWEMGVSCTYCHDRVVHGPKWLYTGVGKSERVNTDVTAYKFTPTMEGCYRCHDGKKAPNTCSTCHVTLGERKPSAFNPAWVEAHRNEVSRHGEEDCQRCHVNTFCQACHRAANPHPGDWVQHHPEQARKDAKGCYSCHLAPAEEKPPDVKNMAFCRACHGLRQEHEQLNWQQIHGRESLADPAACQRCHTQSWCSDCHAISRPHPQEWLARHPAEANRDPQNCRTCHTDQFCASCHEGKKGVPASHAKEWLNRHQFTARESTETCNVCHRTGFCQSCHAKKEPVSHGREWLTQHGPASKAQPAACLLCHTEKDCNSCHGMQMPHPKLWLATHQKAAGKDRSLCERCHTKQSCDSCHKGAFPSSHAPADWLGVHGTQAKKAGANCSLCHRANFCFSCHGIEMPHPKGWAGSAHSAAASKDRAACARCHREDYCNKCHGLAMPHPSAWVTEHGKKALSSAATCVRCHGEAKHECTTCHAALAPSSHQAEGWLKQHAQTGVSNEDLCRLCHGKSACLDCHAKRGVRGVKPS